jgi:hypothetical protein
MLAMNLKYLFREDPAIHSHLKNLIDVAMADGTVCANERMLLTLIGKRNKVSGNLVNDMLQGKRVIAFEIPLGSDLRFSQLYDLTLMMAADHQFDREELKLCRHLAVKLGYPADITADLIDTLTSNIRHGLSCQESMKRASLLLRPRGIH